MLSDDTVPLVTAVDEVSQENVDEIRILPEQEQGENPESPGAAEEGEQRTKYGVVKGKILAGNMHTVNVQSHSLDYDITDSQLNKEARRKAGKYEYVIDFLSYGIIYVLTGIFTGMIAVGIDYIIVVVAQLKYHSLASLLNKCMKEACIPYHYAFTMVVPFAAWLAYDVGFSMCASIPVTYLCPEAMGSGIPQIKAYLNGIKIPYLMRFKTLIVKAVGVCFSVLGGLSVGKEGPMIHSGAIVAAGVSQGKTTSFGFDSGLFKNFRKDSEKRDFVAGGAAAGVAAAFGAPIGGVLFAIEEGCSFMSGDLVVSLSIASVTSYFTLNAIRSCIEGKCGSITDGGLISFGTFVNIDYQPIDFVHCIIIGALGGWFGAFYNQLNINLTKYRMRHIMKKYQRVLEAMIVGAITCGMAMVFMMTFTKDCVVDAKVYASSGSLDQSVQMDCPDGTHNKVANIFMSTPEDTVKKLFHDELGSYKYLSLTLFIITYFTIACITYGLSISSGLFIPTLLTGAAWGRLYGMYIYKFSGSAIVKNAVGKFALLGAAAQLSGVVRMTASITVIILEATNNSTYAFPILLTVVVARFIGSLCNEGLYDMHLEVTGTPLLSWYAPMCSSESAMSLCTRPVKCFRKRERVRDVVKMLQETPHSGFPITDPKDEPESGSSMSCGKLRGLMLRHDIVTLISNRCFENSGVDPTHEMLKAAYPRYKDIDQIEIDEEDMDEMLDFDKVMNPAPYTVSPVMGHESVFNLFRRLGLRHVIVTDDTNEVVGMITRKDLAAHEVTLDRCVLRYINKKFIMPADERKNLSKKQQ